LVYFSFPSSGLGMPVPKKLQLFSMKPELHQPLRYQAELGNERLELGSKRNKRGIFR